MLEKEILTPPEHIYPIDDWRIVEKKYSKKFLAQNETIFALGNGYFGMRGASRAMFCSQWPIFSRIIV